MPDAFISKVVRSSFIVTAYYFYFHMTNDLRPENGKFMGFPQAGRRHCCPFRQLLEFIFIACMRYRGGRPAKASRYEL